MKNIFVDIPSFEGLYKINTEGKIYSLISKKFLSQSLSSNGYFVVSLIDKNGKRKTYTVHYLVASSFIINDNPGTKIFINHKDENKKNNRVENLEWCTPKYNSNCGIGIKKMKESLKNFYISERGKEMKIKLKNIHTGVKQSEETIKKRVEKIKEINSNLSIEERREKYMNKEKAKEHSVYMKERMKNLSKEERKELYGRKLTEIEILNMMFSREFFIKFSNLKFKTMYNLNEGISIGDEFCSYCESDFIFPLVKN